MESVLIKHGTLVTASETVRRISLLMRGELPGLAHGLALIVLPQRDRY
jgi:hypothetical protein